MSEEDINIEKVLLWACKNSMNIIAIKLIKRMSRETINKNIERIREICKKKKLFNVEEEINNKLRIT